MPVLRYGAHPYFRGSFEPETELFHGVATNHHGSVGHLIRNTMDDETLFGILSEDDSTDNPLFDGTYASLRYDTTRTMEFFATLSRFI